MKIYVIEDDPSVVGVLEDIVESNGLGTLCGECSDGNPDLELINTLNPDLVLVDLLMPGKDGIQIVRELKKMGCASRFIMISQVSAKEMIAKAYLAGVNFFISKPLNLIEIRQVISNVQKEIENERALNTIRGVFAQKEEPAPPKPEEHELQCKRIQYALSQLGMAGEKGSKDIIEMCVYLMDHNLEASQISVGALCGKLSSSPKSMEQRVRRTVERGLRSLASIGLEDYGNELFTRCAAVLYPFPEVRAEMDHMRGKGEGGKVNLKKFLDGMLILAEEY